MALTLSEFMPGTFPNNIVPKSSTRYNYQNWLHLSKLYVNQQMRSDEHEFIDEDKFVLKYFRYNFVSPWTGNGVFIAPVIL